MYHTYLENGGGERCFGGIWKPFDSIGANDPKAMNAALP